MVHGVIQRAVSEGKIVIVATNESAEAESCDRQISVEDFR